MKNARKVGLDHPEACAPVVALLFTARALRAHLVRVLSRLSLTEDQFSALLVLHSHDPGLLVLNAIARDAELSTASAQECLAALAADKRVTVVPYIQLDQALPPPGQDCESSPRYALTYEGRVLVTTVVRKLFKIFERCSCGLTSGERYALAQTCAHVRAGLPTVFHTETT